MSQAVAIALHLKSMNDKFVPDGMQALYYALMLEGGCVLSCKKKFMRRHYEICVEHCMDDGLTEGKFYFHLTPKKSWWEYKI